MVMIGITCKIQVQLQYKQVIIKKLKFKKEVGITIKSKETRVTK